MLFVMFHKSGDYNDIQDGTVRLCFFIRLLQVKAIYGAFTGVTVLAVIILALLRKPANESTSGKKLTQEQLLSKCQVIWKLMIWHNQD